MENLNPEIKYLTRIAATIYADNVDIRKTDYIRRRFIEPLFVDDKNHSLTILDIIDKLESNLAITFESSMVLRIVSDQDFFELIPASQQNDDSYRLEEKRYRLLCKHKENEFLDVCNRYIRTHTNLDLSSFKNLRVRQLNCVIGSQPVRP